MAGSVGTNNLKYRFSWSWAEICVCDKMFSGKLLYISRQKHYVYTVSVKLSRFSLNLTDIVRMYHYVMWKITFLPNKYM